MGARRHPGDGGAITTDGAIPLGEVLLFPGSRPATCEFAYAVGAAHRGRALAARGISALLPVARDRGYRTATLTIARDNTASHAVAAPSASDRSPFPCDDGSERATCCTWPRGAGRCDLAASRGEAAGRLEPRVR